MSIRFPNFRHGFGRDSKAKVSFVLFIYWSVEYNMVEYNMVEYNMEYNVEYNMVKQSEE